MLKKLKIKVIKKSGRCPHEVGDTWETDYTLIKPSGRTNLCDDAHYSLIPYLGMAAGNAKSWEKDGKWKIHCPSKSGIVFEIEILDNEHSWPKDDSWAKIPSEK